MPDPCHAASEAEADMLARVHRLALAAMAEAAAPVLLAVGSPERPYTRLKLAWIKSIGRVPGMQPPPGWREPPPPRPMAAPQGGGVAVYAAGGSAYVRWANRTG